MMSGSENCYMHVSKRRKSRCTDMFAALVESRWHLARVTLVPATKEIHTVQSFLSL